MRDRAASDCRVASTHERRVGRQRVLVLLVLLASFAALKLVQTPARDYYGPDGSTYFQVARHVAEGDGLVTSVSLYHQGLKHLPSPTTIYPLWPLLLGVVGRIVGLERAARVLPELLYLIDLALLYALADRVANAWRRDRSDPAPGGPLGLGHVAVLLLGLNPIFVRYSSLPYTEPLALGLVFASLLLLARHADRGGLLAALSSGACAAAAYLARTAMIVVPVAVVATLLLVGWRSRAGRRATLAAALGAAIVVLPWLAFLAFTVGELRPMMLVDVFTVYRQTPELDPVIWIVPVRSFAELLRFVADGMVAAFRYGGLSYVRSFGLVAYAVPLALGCLLLSPRLRAGLDRGPGRAIVLGTALCGLGLAVMAHAAHSESDFARLWAFDHRQGLPFILLVVSALACLLSGARERSLAPLRVVVLLLVALSIASSARTSYREFVHPRGREPTGPERDLAAWLAAQPDDPVVISSRAPKLAVISRAGFHWIDCGDEPEQARRLFRYVGADYLVVRRSDRRCRFMRGLEPELELVERFPGRPPLELFRPRAHAG
jgi:hypothetical protein